MRGARWLLLCWMVWPAGCVESYQGSHIQLTLQGVPPPCEAVTRFAPDLVAGCTNDKQANRFPCQYALWATVRRSAVVFLTTFTVQQHLFPEELIALERAGTKRSDGSPLKLGHTYTFAEASDSEKKIAATQMEKLATVNAITSFAPQMFNTDPAKKDWLAEGFFLGGFLQITLPLNGKYYGQVEAKHPFGNTRLSGASLKVPARLDDLDSLMISIEPGSVVTPRSPSFRYLSGVTAQVSRRTINVEAVSSYDPGARATFAVFSDLDEEDYY